MLLVYVRVEAPEGLLALSHIRRRAHPRVPVSFECVGIAGAGLGAADHLEPLARSDASAHRLLLAAARYARGPVAALLGFEFADTFSSCKTGWEPATKHLGSGILLHSGAIERALERRLVRYDFLRGAEPHRLALGGVASENAACLIPNGPVGRLLEIRDRLSEWHGRRTGRWPPCLPCG